MISVNSPVSGTASETYIKQSAKTSMTPAERYKSEKLEMKSFNLYNDENDTVFISEESKKVFEEFIQNKQKKEFSVTESGDIMENGLILNIDPHGEIENTAYFEELAKQLNDLSDTVNSYYSAAHAENLRFDDPYKHIQQKYKISHSPYFRSDMSEDERNMAFRQEQALLWGGSLNLGDPYALAATGGKRDIDKAVAEAVKNRMTQAKQDFIAKLIADGYTQVNN